MKKQIKEVCIEKVKNAEKILNESYLTKADLDQAIAKALRQIDTNLEYFKEEFPTPACLKNQYPKMNNTEWTNGFYTGMLWLAYEFTKDDKYRKVAEANVQSFYERIENQIELEHHDLGFLYTLSCVAAYKVSDSEIGKKAALLAADKLMTRYQEKGEFIQAWGDFDNPEHYRFIIDCMLNIPLLYFASEETGNPKYREVAEKHFLTSCNYVVRDDASAFHTFYMDPQTGAPLYGKTRQGYSDDSSWARGQAWGIYGIPLNYHYTKNKECFALYKGMSNYFLNRLPNDNICYWDLIFDDTSNQSRDSSAAAIAVCGFHEMNKYLPEIDEDKPIYHHAMHLIMRSLIRDYANEENNPGGPLLKHGVYSWHSKKGVDEGNIWGDYFYLEALMRFSNDWNLYW